jgi:hypothetical protein
MFCPLVKEDGVCPKKRTPFFYFDQRNRFEQASSLNYCLIESNALFYKKILQSYIIKTTLKLFLGEAVFVR